MQTTKQVNKYDTYKDSGIEWIGEIPQEWSLSKYKFFARSGMGETILSEQLVENGIPVYSATQEEKVFGYVSEANVNLEHGDLVIPARGNSIGCVTFVKNNFATCTQTTIYSKLNNIYNKFLYYCCLGLKDNWFEFDDTAIPQITVRQVQNNPLPLPDINVQQAIADYLDKKCGEIDKFVEAEKSVIEKLKEYKQSIITEAVTKGLDKSTPLKDSGIEWIGKIPQYWEVEKLKNLYSFGKGLSITKDDLTENGISVISYGQIHSKTNTGTHIADDLIRFVPENYLENNSQSLVRKGDFIFADTSEDIEGAGNCVFVDKEITLFAGYHSIILRNKLPDYILGKYLSYLFKTIQWRTQVRSKVNGIKVYSISQKILKELTVLVPNKQEEQQQIVEYLDQKCSEIDKAIADKEQLIEKFTEYKKSLIYECVTGKRKVVA